MILSYLNHHHLFDATVWFNSGLNKNISEPQPYIEEKIDNLSYHINYNTNLDKLSLNTRVGFTSSYIAGLHSHKVTIKKSDAKKNSSLDVTFLSLYRPRLSNMNYLLNPYWVNRKFNNRIDVNLNHKYKYKNGEGDISLSLK